MQTSIRKVSPVEYELVIDATADELAPVVERRLRDQRANISLKGFRKGKVPLSLLKKRFGESLVIDALEDAIRDTFFEKVVEPDEYQVVGLPRLSEFDYRLDGDLHAVMKFSVRPQVEIADLYALFSIPHINQVYMLYRGQLCGGAYAPGEESLECALFRAADVPWEELAFPVVHETLQRYFRDKSRGDGFPLQRGNIVRHPRRRVQAT